MIIEALFSHVYDEKFIYQLLATLSVYLSLNILHFYRQRYKRYQLFKYYNIPGPKPNLLDGNLRIVRNGLNDHELEEELSRKYGKIYGYFIGDEPTLIIKDPEILRKIFFEKMSSFTERARVNFRDHGIFFAPYKKWKFFRKIMSPSFSRYSVRGGLATQFIEDTIKLMLNYIDQKHSEAKANGNTAALIDIHELMKSTALYLISAIALKLPNIQVNEADETVKKLDTFLNTFGGRSFRLLKMFPVLNNPIHIFINFYARDKALGFINCDIDSVIKESLAKFSNHNKMNDQELQVIDILARLYQDGKSTRKEIQSNTDALLFAGYDTTSTTLTYVFWVLAKYPDIQEKLRTELLAHGIESKYLEQVINETMRLYPTVTVFTTRVATKTVVINDLVIPQGTKVMANHWLIHRDPSLWPNPLEFDPERFCESADIQPGTFIPFGLGERKCIGYQLAMIEMKMITCDILIRYNFKLISPQNLELVPYAVNLTKPKDKVVLEWTKR